MSDWRSRVDDLLALCPHCGAEHWFPRHQAPKECDVCGYGFPSADDDIEIMTGEEE